MKPVIVLVDTEQSVRQAIGGALSDAGFICIPTGSGIDALRFIEANLYPLDLLLSNVRMPGSVNGLDLAQRFQALNPGAPVILISTHVGRKLPASIEGSGYQVLIKPLRAKQIVAAVEAALEPPSQ